MGLVGDSKYGELREEFLPLVFLPTTQDSKPTPFATLVVRPRRPCPTPSPR